MTDLEREIFRKYGALLTTEKLADVFGYSSGRSVLNAISNESFPVRTRKAGKFRVADYRDVAQYLEGLREAG